MVTNMPTVSCDIAGCRSVTSLTAREAADIPKALEARGWKVTGDGDAAKHVCPGCKSFGRVLTPNLNG